MPKFVTVFHNHFFPACNKLKEVFKIHNLFIFYTYISYVFIKQIPMVYCKQKVSKTNHKIIKFQPKKSVPPWKHYNAIHTKEIILKLFNCCKSKQQCILFKMMNNTCLFICLKHHHEVFAELQVYDGNWWWSAHFVDFMINFNSKYRGCFKCNNVTRLAIGQFPTSYGYLLKNVLCNDHPYYSNRGINHQM